MKIQRTPKKQSKWRPQCSVCQMCRRNKQFRDRLFASSYFNQGQGESPTDVNRDFNSPFKQTTLYACLKRHHYTELIRPPSKIVDGKLIVDNRIKPTFDVIETLPAGITSNHEMGLDDFIQQGREKLARGELQITATTFLQAIKTKMDNDAKTKDRRADLLSGLFKGAAPKKIDDV